MYGKSDYSGALYAFSEVVHFVSLAVKPSQYRWVLFFPILCCCGSLVLFTSSDNLMNDYTMGCTAFITVGCALDQIILTEVQRELRLKDQKGPITNAPLAERLRWGTKLFFCPRGVGWIHEPTSKLQQHPAGRSRRSFVLSRLVQAARCILLYDLSGIHMRSNPSYAKGDVFLTSFGWWWRFTSGAFGLSTFAHLQAGHCLLSAVFVGLGSSEPKDWPPLFGRWSDAYSVRRFWGQTWHQNLRRSASVPGKFLAQKVFHARSGTNMSSYIQLFTAFFISGAIHYAGDCMAMNNWKGGSLKFFFVQAFAITFEDAVIALAARTGLKKANIVFKIIGYIWVINWFMFSLPIALDPLLQIGVAEDGLAYSVILGVWKGQWRPTWKHTD